MKKRKRYKSIAYQLDRVASLPSLDPVLPEAGFTLQQALKLTGLSEHALHYFESVALLKEAAGDLSQKNGDAGNRSTENCCHESETPSQQSRHPQSRPSRRRYQAAEIITLRILADLQAAGMSLQQMREYEQLRQQGELSLSPQSRQFEAQQQLLQMEIELAEWHLEFTALKIGYYRASQLMEDDKGAEYRRKIEEQMRRFLI